MVRPFMHACTMEPCTLACGMLACLLGRRRPGCAGSSAPTHLHPPGRAGPDPRDLKLESSPRAEPALFERLDNLFGYLTRKFVGSNGVAHQFPICVGESGSAFLYWPLPEPVRRPLSPELHHSSASHAACARVS